jgi:hypothetical protein
MVRAGRRLLSSSADGPCRLGVQETDSLSESQRGRRLGRFENEISDPIVIELIIVRVAGPD